MGTILFTKPYIYVAVPSFPSKGSFLLQETRLSFGSNSFGQEMIENKKLYFLTPVQFKQFKILWAMPLGDLHTETESLPWIRRHVPSLAYNKRKIIQDCLLAENRRRAEQNNYTDSG